SARATAEPTTPAPTTATSDCTGSLPRDRVRTDPLALGVEEGLARNLSLDPAAEDLHREGRARVGVLGWHKGVGDRALDRVPVAPAGHPAADLPVDPHRLVAQG